MKRENHGPSAKKAWVKTVFTLFLAAVFLLPQAGRLTYHTAVSKQPVWDDKFHVLGSVKDGPKVDYEIYDAQTKHELMTIETSFQQAVLPRVTWDETHVSVLFHGRNENQSKIYRREDGTLYRRLYHTSPRLIQFHKDSLRRFSRALPGAGGTVLLDGMETEQGYLYFSERLQKRGFSGKGFGAWEKTRGEITIGNRVLSLNEPIAGTSALDIRALRAQDKVYFPTISGIRVLDLNTLEVAAVLEESMQRFTRVELYPWGEGFLVVRQYPPPEDANSVAQYAQISWYDGRFRLVKTVEYQKPFLHMAVGKSSILLTMARWKGSQEQAGGSAAVLNADLITLPDGKRHEAVSDFEFYVISGSEKRRNEKSLGLYLRLDEQAWSYEEGKEVFQLSERYCRRLEISSVRVDAQSGKVEVK